MTRLVLLTCALLCYACEGAEGVTVETEYGLVRGKTMEVTNTRETRSVDVFRGIPYAMDTSGSRRFANPVKMTPWGGERDALTAGDACPQIRIGTMTPTHPEWRRYSEDCLHLDIVSPDVTGGPYPVMVWVHGGGFMQGANVQYPGHFLAMRDIVVVSINYRLAKFGFAFTANDAIPGNAGLYDQKMALEFVIDNIAQFGGDPDRITVFGESAGGTSTGLLMVSPQTKDLFHQAIVESGGETRILMVDTVPNPEVFTYQMADSLGCGSLPDDYAMLDCMRQADWQQVLYNASIDCPVAELCSPFIPVVDGPDGFLPQNPMELRKAGDVMKGPMIAGICKDDGSISTLATVPLANFGCCNRSAFEWVLRERYMKPWSEFFDDVTEENFFQALLWRYTPWPYLEDADRNLESLVQLSTDMMYGAYTDLQLKSQQQVAPTYGYLFDYRSKLESLPEWMGVSHASDVSYVWGYTLLQYNPEVAADSEFSANMTFDEDDVQFGLFLQDLFTNFAKTGNPSPSPVPNPQGGDTVWETFTDKERRRLRLNNNVTETISDYRQPEYAFWGEYKDYLVNGIESDPEGPTSVLVQIAGGEVRGKRMFVDNGQDVGEVDVFRGIPYAAPPTGQRRFSLPEPVSPWRLTFDASTPGDACPQTMESLSATHKDWDRLSEDCLHLDIVSPDVSQGPYPVMVWIHGGGFQQGANFQYPGHFLAMHDVVVVNINYRLGNLGYTYTGSEAAPGNAGLWDQKMALEFVIANIAAFGGDPSQITVIGQSAGGSSTSLMMLSPHTKDLFQRAILQSGHETNPFALYPPESEPANYTYQMAEAVGCGQSSPPDDSAMMNCLRTKDWEQLIYNVSIQCTPGYYCWNLGPVVDGPGGYIPKTPAELREDGDIMKGPILSGITRDDGSLNVPLDRPASECCDRDTFQNLLRDGYIARKAAILDDDREEDIFEAMDWRYAPWPFEEYNAANLEALVRLATDVNFGVPWDHHLKAHQEVAPSYGYVFNYRGDLKPNPEWLGVSHSTDVPFVFGFPFLSRNPEVYADSEFSTDVRAFYTEEDQEYSLFVQTLFTNFVKTGNPTPEPVPNPSFIGGGETTWPRFYYGDMRVLELSNTTVDTLTDYEQDMYAFWEHYMDFLRYGTPPGSEGD